MTHRNPYVYLDHDEVRCAPRECNRKHSCARYMAPIVELTGLRPQGATNDN